MGKNQYEIPQNEPCSCIPKDADRLRIGYDAKRIVANGTGLGNYGRTLINSLSAVRSDLDLLLYAPDGGRDSLRSQIALRENVHLIYPRGPQFRLYKDYWRTRGIIQDLVKDNVNIYHGLSGELPVGIRKTPIHSVVTVHDLIFMRHPEYYHWWDAQIYALKFRLTCREAERIIAISECTKRDVMYYGGVSEDRIDVVYQSCDTLFTQRLTDDACAEAARRLHLPQRYILNVGTIEARKNVLLAVKALSQLPREVHLVVVGRPTDYAERILRYAREHDLAARIHFLRGISNDDLLAVYQQAECFVYPSRYEGFGIPVIEAIQSSLPVVACTGSCLEEAGGPSSLYVAPDDVHGMAEALQQSLIGASGRSQRIADSRAYIRRFENEDIAQQMLEVYTRLIIDH